MSDDTNPTPTTTEIVVRYATIDRYLERRTFATLAEAQAYAKAKIGTPFDISDYFGYAVDMYGVGKVTAERGCTIHQLMGVEP